MSWCGLLAVAIGFKRTTRASQHGVVFRFGKLRDGEVIQRVQALRSWTGKQTLPIFQAKLFSLVGLCECPLLKRLLLQKLKHR